MPKIIKNGIEYGSASHAENVSYDNSSSGLSANNVQDAIDQKQNKIQIKSFTATSDSAGNILIPDLTVSSNVIVSCMASNAYATGAVPSGNSFYFKVLSNNSPVTPVTNTSMNCYVLYY